MSLHNRLLFSLGVCALFFACGDSGESGSQKNDCEEAADDVEDKAEECGIELDDEDGGDPPECTSQLGAESKCVAACISDASCEALNGEDTDASADYIECVVDCAPEEGGGPPTGGGGEGGAGAGNTGGDGAGGSTPELTCQTACEVIFECGLEGSPQYCPGYTASDESLFVPTCVATCGDMPSMIALVDPSDCEDTVGTIASVNVEFASFCEEGP